MTQEEFIYCLRKAGCVVWMHMIEEALTEHSHTLQITDEQSTVAFSHGLHIFLIT